MPPMTSDRPRPSGGHGTILWPFMTQVNVVCLVLYKRCTYKIKFVHLYKTRKIQKYVGSWAIFLRWVCWYWVVENDIIPWPIVPTSGNNKAWGNEPDIALKDYTNAYQWILEKKYTFLHKQQYCFSKSLFNFIIINFSNVFS